MMATPLPESGHEMVEDDISLPFGLYFSALNHPHWSTYDHADPTARKQAEAAREKVRETRMQKIPQMFDHLHAVKVAAGALTSFDRNGQGPSAAENLRIATQRFKTQVDQFAAAIEADAKLWRENGLRATHELIKGVADVDLGTVTKAETGSWTLGIPHRQDPTPAEMAKIVPARQADIFRRPRP